MKIPCIKCGIECAIPEGIAVEGATCGKCWETSATGIEALVCQDIATRQRQGIAKYGKTVAGNPLPLSDWLRHAYEEALDLAIYLRRAMSEIEQKGKR